MTIGAAGVHAVLTLERQRLAELRRTTEHRRVRAELVRSTPRVRDQVAAALVRAGLAPSPRERDRWLRRTGQTVSAAVTQEPVATP